MLWKRMTVVTAILGIAFSLMYMRVFWLTSDDSLVSAGTRQGRYTLPMSASYANIYDCAGRKLNNLDSETRTMAALCPTAENVRDILPYVKPEDQESFYKKVQAGLPFTCQVTVNSSPNPDIIVYEEPVRYGERTYAPHILGYTSGGAGVSGIEYAFQDFFSSHVSRSSVTFELDGLGKPLIGEGREMELSQEMTAGVVTTLDRDIQSICEKAASQIQRGAVVVMDPYTGDIKASVSVPDFHPSRLGDYLEDPASPLVNRALSAYNVGSVFKIVTASASLEEGISPNFPYRCEGYLDMNGQIFRCHKLEGHGVLDMQGAISESCNPYFITLGRQIPSLHFVNTAYAFGFGKPCVLCPGVVSSAGNLQSAEELGNEAEKANLSFGQGRLTATPLQVAGMTCAVVNQGKLPRPRLILGTTEDGKSRTIYQETMFSEAIQPVTALRLKDMLEKGIHGTTASGGVPETVTAGGKTSTAQTGQFHEDGTEIVQAWFTGFFPAESPRYVVTVLAEDGKSGNSSAGPVFKEIADEVAALEAERDGIRIEKILQKEGKKD